MVVHVLLQKPLIHLSKKICLTDKLTVKVEAAKLTKKMLISNFFQIKMCHIFNIRLTEIEIEKIET